MRVKVRIGCLVVITLVLCMVGTASAAANPTVGSPPKAGSYKLRALDHPLPGSGLALKRDGSSYVIERFRLRIDQGDGECGQYEDQTATISRKIKLRRHIFHHTVTNELTYWLPRIKHFNSQGRGNAKVSIGGETVVGNLEIAFERGVGAASFEPMYGDLALAGVEGNAYSHHCDVIFAGDLG